MMSEENKTDKPVTGKERGIADLEAWKKKKREEEQKEIDRIDLRPGSEISVIPIEWLWDGWLAAGKIHILAGQPGTGKTTLTLALATAISVGGRWPDGSRAPHGNVVIWSGEDDPGDTLVPRLMLLGADLSRIFFISGTLEQDEKRPFNPATDMDLVYQKVMEVGNVKLLILDPVVSAIKGDSHKNAEVRNGLQPLIDLGLFSRAAILGISHFSKNTSGKDPVERINGSVAFGAVARIVMVAAKRQDVDEIENVTRVILRAKSNIGPDFGGYEYELYFRVLDQHPDITAMALQWGKEVRGSAKDILDESDSSNEDSNFGLPAAARWLKTLLMEEREPVDAKEIVNLAAKEGFSQRTIYRAKDKIGAKTRSFGFGKNKRTVWGLNEFDPNIDEA